MLCNYFCNYVNIIFLNVIRLPKRALVEKFKLSWNLQLFLLEVDGFLVEILPQRLHFLLSANSVSVKDFISGLVRARRLG